MKRSQVIAAVGAIAALILLVLTLRQVSALREDVADLQDDLFKLEQSSITWINSMGVDIRQELEREASLFSSAKTRVDFRDGALVLTVRVFPKAVGADETLTLSAGGVSAPMEPGADGVYTGELTLPPAKEISPAVAFTSPEGIRQETLESLYTSDILTVEGESRYETGEDGRVTAVYVGVNPYGSSPVEGRADVASFTLRVADAATGGALGAVELEPVLPPDSPPPDPIPDEDGVSSVNTSLLWYSAHIDTYTAQDDYDLELWAALTTAGGLELTDVDPVLSITLDGNHGFGVHGIFSLSPTWDD